MRFVITDRPVPRSTEYRILPISVQTATTVSSFFKDNKLVAIDTETNGQDPYINSLLLISFGNEVDQYVLLPDAFEMLNTTHGDSHIWIAHNGKFDYGMLCQQLNFKLHRIWDTMVAHQKEHQGMLYNAKDRPFGVRARLTDMIAYTLGVADRYMDKEVRLQFVGKNPSTFIPTEEQILYSLTDVRYLIPAANVQRRKLGELGLLWYMDMSMYLIGAVSEDELEGWIINKQQWITNIKNNEEEKFRIECEMDDCLLMLRNTLLLNEDRYMLTGGKFTHKRQKNEMPEHYSLFEGLDVSAIDIHKTTRKTSKTTLKKKAPKVQLNKANVNWSSTTQVVNVFARLQSPLPTQNPQQPVVVPILNKQGKIANSAAKFTTKKDDLAIYLAENPEAKGKELLKLLLQYRKVEHELSSFGQNFLDKINPVTNKLHTTYRTDNTETGRFQSGQLRTNWPNLQNIPRKEVIRTAFTVDTANYSVITADLSGAEVVIMCDKARDSQLYEWAVKNDDAHSPIATACWRNVYLYQAGLFLGLWKNPKTFWKNRDNSIRTLQRSRSFEVVDKLMNLYETFTISKTENKAMRQDFKPITFGTVYGMHYKKCAKALNLSSVDEGAIVIETIRRAIPDTFEYVESCAEFALQNGYVIIDTRTNSRINYPEILQILETGGEVNDNTLDWRDKTRIEGSARNVTIQGTQASMLKEAMTEIHLWKEHHKFDAGILNNVHDELNIRCPRAYDGVNGQQTVLWYSDEAKLELAPRRELYLPVVWTDSRTDTDLISTGKAHHVTFTDFVKLTMQSAANRYLTHYKMGVSAEVADTWVK